MFGEDEALVPGQHELVVDGPQLWLGLDIVEQTAPEEVRHRRGLLRGQVTHGVVRALLHLRQRLHERAVVGLRLRRIPVRQRSWVTSANL